MILINVFLAIMNDSYTEVNEQAIKAEKGFKAFPLGGMKKVIKKKYDQLFGKKELEELKIADKDGDGTISKVNV